MEEHFLQTEPVGLPGAPRLLSRLARRAVLGRLEGLRQGQLTVVDGLGRRTFGATTAEFPLPIRVTVHNAFAYGRVAGAGTIGAGEAYFHGDFDTNDLTGLMRLFVANRDTMQSMERGAAWLRLPFHKLVHRLRGHDTASSRANIAAHYDLGNAFFRAFLDRRHMMYSGAYYEQPDTGLEAAAEAKLERICRKLELAPGHHVLDIGGGWGGFAVYAATHYGCRVTMTTLSQEQFRHARERAASAGLEDRVTVLNADYRELTGGYDRIVSIEMIEAIGHDAFDGFFAVCDTLLKPGGVILIQAITIAEPFYEEARRTVDFIQRYIFPGGALPALSVLSQAIGRRRSLHLDQLEDLGLHYARTLKDWRARLRQNWQGLQGQGYDETFLRMWEFYLCYCEAGFLERSTGLVQLRIRKSEPGTSAVSTEWAGVSGGAGRALVELGGACARA
jgi:cyclopropane-fatty-acyl-phospholipid synthase